MTAAQTHTGREHNTKMRLMLRFGAHAFAFQPSLLLLGGQVLSAVSNRSPSLGRRMTITGDAVPVLYNNCYGGFGFSDKAIDEYNRRLPAGSTQVKYEWEIGRADPLMVQICRELGDEADEEISKIAIGEVPRKFKDHLLIHEYNGLETVQIDIQRYKLDRINGILSDKVVSNDDKVKMAQEVLLEKNPFEEVAN